MMAVALLKERIEFQFQFVLKNQMIPFYMFRGKTSLV